MEKAFWMVWREGGTAPTKKHMTQQSAAYEASRLARDYKGSRFHVLQSVASVVHNDLKWTTHVTSASDSADDDNDLPF